MTRYLGGSFSVTGSGSQQYRDNWERTFRSQTCGDKIDNGGQLLECEAPKAHVGSHWKDLGHGSIVTWGDQGAAEFPCIGCKVHSVLEPFASSSKGLYCKSCLENYE